MPNPIAATEHMIGKAKSMYVSPNPLGARADTVIVQDAGADDDIVPPNISQHPFNAIEVTILACIVLVASIVLAMHEMQVQVVDGPEYPIWEATRM